MKKIKLLARILFYTICFLLLLIAALHFTLVYVAPLESVKQKVITTIHEQTLADVNIGSISASIFDFQVKDIDLNIKEQNIAHIDTIYIHFSLIKLLKGQVKVDRITLENLNTTIIKDKNGKFNFDPIFEAPIFQTTPEEQEKKAKEEAKKKKNKEDEENSAINLLLHRTHLQNCNITYIDEQSNMKITLSKTTFNMKSFNLDNSFKVDFFTNIYAKINDMEINSLEVALSAFSNLHEIDLSKAELKIDSFILRLKDTVIVTKGIISNFDNPKANILTSILNLCSESFVEIAELPQFKIPEIDIQTIADINLNNSLVNIEKFNISVMDSTINANGNINYGSQELQYNINIIINFVLDKICQAIEMTKIYKPTGLIQANLNVTNQKSVVSGNCSLVNISAFTPQLGDFTEINSTINIKNINDIKVPTLTGKLNKYPFESSASYVIGKDKGDIKANFSADRIFGKMSKEYEQEIKKKDEETKKETESKVEEVKPKEEKSEFPLPPLDVLVNVDIKDIDVPYFMGKDIKFKMDMKKVTPDLNAVAGTLDLSTDNGTIKDIYKLTESNVVIKGLFLSLKIVSDVINALNVLDILNSIGSALVSSEDENQNPTEMTQEHQEAQNQKIDGKIDFVSFVTSIDFENGKGIFNSCSFVSNLLSFKVGGEMNFNENILDMTVNAAPGKHEEEGGIMPLTMKIGGTMDEPSGSLSLLGSVATLVGDALTKNAVSDKLKSGFMKLLGMKKCDEKGNDIVESTTTVNTNSVISSTDTTNSSRQE